MRALHPPPCCLKKPLKCYLTGRRTQFLSERLLSINIISFFFLLSLNKKRRRLPREDRSQNMAPLKTRRSSPYHTRTHTQKLNHDKRHCTQTLIGFNDPLQSFSSIYYLMESECVLNRVLHFQAAVIRHCFPSHDGPLTRVPVCCC